MRLTLAALALTVQSWACSIIYPNIAVSPNLLLRVDNQGQPVASLRVVLSDNAKGTKQETITDHEGVVRFQNLSPGNYFLTAGHDPGIQAASALTVKPGKPGKEVLILDWPGSRIVRVQSLGGIIRTTDPAANRFEIGLQEAITGKDLTTTNTNHRGEFDLGQHKPGLYFLRLTDGWIPVALDPQAKSATLDLDIGSTSCGLYYTHRGDCPVIAPLRTSKLHGQVADSSGAAIPNAQVLLRDPNGAIVERLSTGPDGHFAAPRTTGTYELEIRYSGVIPYRQTVHLDPSSPATPLYPRLGFMGACSTRYLPH